MFHSIIKVILVLFVNEYRWVPLLYFWSFVIGKQKKTTDIFHFPSIHKRVVHKRAL